MGKKWIKNNLSWVLLGMSVLFLIIRILQGCKTEEDPAINRLEELNRKIEANLLRDSLLIEKKKDKIVLYQDTIIYRTKTQNNIIKTNNEKITYINTIDGTLVILPEFNRAIRQLDSLDKSGFFFIHSNPN
jgi:hypothetical protein